MKKYLFGCTIPHNWKSSCPQAFDMVDHESQLKKAENAWNDEWLAWNMTGSYHTWVTVALDTILFEPLVPWLDNRKQFCSVDGTSSNVKGINCGIPQGSCLYPFLFLISMICLFLGESLVSFQKHSWPTKWHIHGSFEASGGVAFKQTFSERYEENTVTSYRLWSKYPLDRKPSQPDPQPSFQIGDEHIEMITNIGRLGFR